MITASHLIFLPIFIYSFYLEIKISICIQFAFAIFTDFPDGYLLKKLGATSDFGSNFDAFDDFLFTVGSLTFFVLEGFYSWRVLFLMVLVFTQFVLTSLHSKRAIYDPIGKYYRRLLYAVIRLTLMSRDQLTYTVMTASVVVFTFYTLLTRLV